MQKEKSTKKINRKQNMILINNNEIITKIGKIFFKLTDKHFIKILRYPKLLIEIILKLVTITGKT